MRPSRVSFSPNWNFRYLLIIEDHQIVWGMGVESISSTEKMVASPISFVVLWLNMLKPQMCPTAWLICQVPSIQQQSTKPAHDFSMFFLKVEYRGFHKGGYPNSWKRMETPINIWMILGGTPHDLGNLHMLAVSTCFFPAFIMVSQAR